MTNNERTAHDFFDAYGAALLARDAEQIADHYAVPALIEFPGQAIPVDDRQQTVEFFKGAFEQYAKVTSAHHELSVVAEAPHSLWVDVAWDYDGAAPAERNMYQLVDGDGWRIAVLTHLVVAAK